MLEVERLKIKVRELESELAVFKIRAEKAELFVYHVKEELEGCYFSSDSFEDSSCCDELLDGLGIAEVETPELIKRLDGDLSCPKADDRHCYAVVARKDAIVLSIDRSYDRLWIIAHSKDEAKKMAMEWHSRGVEVNPYYQADDYEGEVPRIPYGVSVELDVLKPYPSRIEREDYRLDRDTWFWRRQLVLGDYGVIMNLPWPTE